MGENLLESLKFEKTKSRILLMMAFHPRIRGFIFVAFCNRRKRDATQLLKTANVKQEKKNG
jgi:hypothetical protein